MAVISKGKDWVHEGIVKIQVISKEIDRKELKVKSWAVKLFGKELATYPEFKDANVHAWDLYVNGTGR